MASKKKKNQHRYNISIKGKPCVVCIGAGLEQAQADSSAFSLDSSLNLSSLKNQPKGQNKQSEKIKKYQEEIRRLQNEKEHYRRELTKSQASKTNFCDKEYLDSAFNSLFPKNLRKKMNKKEIKRLKKLFKKEFSTQMDAQGSRFNVPAYPVINEEFDKYQKNGNNYPSDDYEDFDDYRDYDDYQDDFSEDDMYESTDEVQPIVRPLARNKKKTFNASSYVPQGGKYYLDNNRSIEVSVYTKPNDKEKEILDYLSKHPSATQIELANVMALSRSTIADYTSTLKTKGLLHREGTRRSGRWVVSSH